MIMVIISGCAVHISSSIDSDLTMWPTVDISAEVLEGIERPTSDSRCKLEG